MSSDSQQHDSRIGPDVEDSRNDLGGHHSLQGQQPRSGGNRPIDSQFQRPRRTVARLVLSRSRLLWGAAALLLMASALLLWRSHTAPSKVQTLPELALDQPPSAHASVDAVPVPAPTIAASAPKTFVASLQDVYGEVKSGVATVKSLLDGQRAQQETLAKLEHDVGDIAAAVAQMKQVQAQAAAAPRPPAHRVVKAPATPVAAASAPAQRQAQLLAIDIWDGKPSVVIGTTDRADRVRFLREGDQQAGVTLKQADTRRQRAVFDMAGRELELTRDGDH